MVLFRAAHWLFARAHCARCPPATLKLQLTPQSKSGQPSPPRLRPAGAPALRSGCVARSSGALASYGRGSPFGARRGAAAKAGRLPRPHCKFFSNFPPPHQRTCRVVTRHHIFRKYLFVFKIYKRTEKYILRQCKDFLLVTNPFTAVPRASRVKLC